MDDYKIISLIGEGSFGRVYKACQKLDGKNVAIKIIKKGYRTSRELKNLRRECEIQAHLKHPNIVEMLRSFETKNELVVVTEFAQTDLHKYLRQHGVISEDRAQVLTAHLVSALYYLHSHRVLHRDLKPQNILLGDNLHAKLCDFGLARNMTAGTHVLTSIKGTPLYMAPELLAEKPYDHLADFWSLGCIIFETLVGQPPFHTNSFLQLVCIIKHEDVKLPSFLKGDCVSFIQGLLEKDPALRLSWAQILCHPFVEGRLTILDENMEPSPFIDPPEKLPAPKKRNFNCEDISANLSHLSMVDNPEAGCNLTSSKDSIKAMLQSDVENIDTDVEDVRIPFSDTPSFKFQPRKPSTDNAVCFVSGNSNLVVNHLHDNFQVETGAVKQKAKLTLNLKKPTQPAEKTTRSKDLEKRKLSQNLDNFSLKLGQSVVDSEATVKKISENVSEKKQKQQAKSGGLQEEISPPCLLPGWDSCDESQSPPIENDEWLAFLHRSMQEVLDGELDSLKQQNLVSIIVAPLRNTKASPKVLESVVQLLSLPLIMGGPTTTLECIHTVYIEVKLVPNLVYASKLLATTKTSSSDSTSSQAGASCRRTYRPVSELSTVELKTISSLYELCCHLVHLNQRFLSQLCDAFVILAADDLLISFVSHDYRKSDAIRIANNVIALLCCIVRELPENAPLVERIVFHPKMNLVSLMKNKNAQLRTRTCMLMRLLGRFSCRGLQSIWSKNLRDTMEALVYDSNEEVRMEAEGALAEFKQYSFYS